MSKTRERLSPETPLASAMARYSGQETVDRLGSLDLNLDGEVVNLAIVGSSSFYNFEVFEENVEDWISRYGYPDLVIVGGASGVDYMAERWTDANIIPIAVFSEEWNDPTRSLVDRGRAEAPIPEMLTSELKQASFIRLTGCPIFTPSLGQVGKGPLADFHLASAMGVPGLA